MKRPGQRELGEEETVEGVVAPERIQGWARSCGHTEQIGFAYETDGGLGTRGPGDGFEQGRWVIE